MYVENVHISLMITLKHGTLKLLADLKQLTYLPPSFLLLYCS